MFRQSGTRDKSLVPNLPPPLTTSSALMALSVFLFKMSHQGTVNTSISVCPGKPAHRVFKWEKRLPERSFTKGPLRTVYDITNSEQYVHCQAQQGSLLMFNESMSGKKDWVIPHSRLLLNDIVWGFAINPVNHEGMMREMCAITAIFLSGR